MTLSVSEQDKTQLEAIAHEQGMLWGSRPNISRLVEAIARRESLIGRNNDWSSDRILDSSRQCVHFIGTGQIDEAHSLEIGC